MFSISKKADMMKKEEEYFSGRFNLRLPKSLHRNLALTARAEGVSLNQLATALIAGGLKNVTNTY